MLRPINQQQIFEDEEDNQKFLQILKKYKEVSGFRLPVYCLMGNHIHLLIWEGKEYLQQVFKRIGGRFVHRYSSKFQRVRHLFQDRFKSEPVDKDVYLLPIIHYIHQNPVKASICKKLEDYPYFRWRASAGALDYRCCFHRNVGSRADLIDSNMLLGRENYLDVSDQPTIQRTE